MIHPFAGLIDLAQPRLGSAVVYATDDFFADKARLIDPAEPMFIPGKYDDIPLGQEISSLAYQWFVGRYGYP